MNILNEIEEIEDSIIELADGDHTGAELREGLSDVAEDLSYLRNQMSAQERRPIQQRIDDLLNAEYESLKVQALAICEEKELDVTFFDLDDEVEMEEIDEMESLYASAFDFNTGFALSFEEGGNTWLWQEMAYGQKLDILQEIKETIQSLLNPTT